MTHTTRRKLIDRAAVATVAIAALAVSALLWPFGADADAGAGAGAADRRGSDAAGSVPSIEVESEARVTDGRHFGHITAAYVAPAEFVFVPMELLEGDAARQAARADGQAVDDSFDAYARGLGVAAQSLPVAPDVTVTRSGGVPQSYDDFTLALEDTDATGLLFWVTIEDDVVTEIHEHRLS